MNEESAVLLEQAHQSLRAAEVLLEHGFPGEASSRIYYGMFYAAQAVLKALGIDVHKHSAVSSAFGHHLTATGKIEARFHRLLINAREIREHFDYAFEREVVKPCATVSLDDGRAFVDAMEAYLKAEGHV